MQRLEGSCYCGGVQFELDSDQQSPFMLCYCSLCRKLNGSGGFGINLGGSFKSLKVKAGQELISTYPVTLRNAKGKETRTNGVRTFCKVCGSGLWGYSSDYPELVHPYASVVDTALPEPDHRYHIMLKYKADWVGNHHIEKSTKGDRTFEEYPDISLADWHRRQRSKKPT